jgi:hypothetical protein
MRALRSEAPSKLDLNLMRGLGYCKAVVGARPSPNGENCRDGNEDGFSRWPEESTRGTDE